MKVVLIPSIALFAMSAAFAAPFTPGNLVVTRVGDGSAALTNAATATFVDEYTPAGVLVQSIAVPSTGASQCTNSGTATSELSLSFNGGKFAFGGYDLAAGTAGAAASTVARVVAIVDLTGNIDTSTRLANPTYSGNNIRSAVVDGSNVWTAGTASPAANGGIRYAAVGGTSSIQLSADVTNTRVVNVFGGQLYAGTFSGTPFSGVNMVGSGLPTTSGQSFINLVNTSATGNPVSTGVYDFYVNGSTIYGASDQGTGSTGLVKWTSADNGATWTYAYTMATGITTGCRSITISGSTIYVVSSTGSIYSTTDVGAGSAFTLVASPGANTLFRGIKAVPGSSAGATITGSVDLNGYVGTAPGSANVTLQFSILDANTNAVLQGPTNVTVTPSGGSAAYTLNVNSGISGSVKVVGDGATWLKKTINTSVGATNANINLLNGNCVDDSVVDLSDYTVVAVAFNGIFGAAPYDAAADVNKDGIVDLTDYTIVVTNFNAVDN